MDNENDEYYDDYNSMDDDCHDPECHAHRDDSIKYCSGWCDEQNERYDIMTRINGTHPPTCCEPSVWVKPLLWYKAAIINIWLMLANRLGICRDVTNIITEMLIVSATHREYKDPEWEEGWVRANYGKLKNNQFETSSFPYIMTGYVLGMPVYESPYKPTNTGYVLGMPVYESPYKPINTGYLDAVRYGRGTSYATPITWDNILD